MDEQNTMTAARIIPIILCGGAGARLWPMSRSSKPKHFLRFGGTQSLFQQTVLRCRSRIFDPQPIIVGSQLHGALFKAELADIAIDAEILLEPLRRDSCAAIAAGCLAAKARNNDALVLVLAADHHIPDAEAFSRAVAEAAGAAMGGWLVTFGIKPTHAATGYGYIKPGEALPDGRCRTIKRFVEKPDAATAQSYLDQEYLWNSGNFLFKASAFLEELEILVPEVQRPAVQSFEKSVLRHGCRFLDAESFGGCQKISVDFAVMEKTAKAAVFAVNYAWSDIGSWDAVQSMSASDASRNMMSGKTVALHSHGNFVQSEGCITALVGVSDLVVVATGDAVLIARKHETEKVKQLVAKMQASGMPEAEHSSVRLEPWGSAETLAQGGTYRVSRLTVYPGVQMMSEDKTARSWIVVSGTGSLEKDGISENLPVNEPVIVSSAFCVTNTGAENLVMIETATGGTSMPMMESV